MKRWLALGVVLLIGPVDLRAQSITLERVEQMGGLPADYFLRDWERVAQQYDSLVFDPTATGTHLPLVHVYPSGVNHRGGGFGLHTYVGTRSPHAGEAINALPALVGATLTGVNKRAQYGVDWVARAQEYFVDRPGERVYLNTPTATSGQDWWYDTMPNVFFYQLYDLYGSVGDFDAQFRSVADRWHAALGALGGGAAPWRRGSFNYRAFALSTMEPLRSGVVEPEAAGALAWLQYMAYVRTGETKYRHGAEWAMEFLDTWQTNPSYELQMPYGALAAARMNAELGTSYDVEKFVRWSFEMGALRGWGTVAGTWGGYSASGLVGEIRYSDYAFALNGYQQAAALVPIVRYDDRFARAIGKWMMHLASASRLFYHPFLPDEHQDGEAWAKAHDPYGVIPHEAIRERQDNRTPYATGDAVGGGWAATNFALYAGSSVGYLGAIVDTTEVPGILRLDLNATDFFADSAYATSLYYNPHATPRTVTVVLPPGVYDLYDTFSDRYMARAQSGHAPLHLEADAARVLVLVPSGKDEVLADGRRVVGGVTVDYRVGTPVSRPRVKAFVASKARLGRSEAVTLYCTGDEGTGALTYDWTSTGGTFAGGGTVGATRVRSWASDAAGVYTIACSVRDASGSTTSDTLSVEVLANLPPAIVTVEATPEVVLPGAQVTLSCLAMDPEGDALAYSWHVEAGTLSGGGASATWTTPEGVGTFRATCTAQDAVASDTASTRVTVGDLVADLPLAGDGHDVSGFEHNGQIVGATATFGVDGQDRGALQFDGVDDHVAVPATHALNPTQAISVVLWVRVGTLPTPAREMFVASHGSWQNRWKLSITPEGTLRWTVNTNVGIVDLDGAQPLPLGRYVPVAATFGEGRMRLYIDGVLVGDRGHEGRMAPFAGPLLLAQMLPGEAAFNLAGALAGLRVYNRVLSASEVEALVVTREFEAPPGEGVTVSAPMPNPSSGEVRVLITAGRTGPLRAVIYDLLGREVRVLVEGVISSGTHVVEWDGESEAGLPVSAGVYTLVVSGQQGRQVRSLVRVR